MMGRQKKILQKSSEQIDNHEILEILYKKYWTVLCGWLRKRYGNGPPDPEDIAQIAFEKIATVNLENITNVRGFLFTIASRQALNNIRDRANLTKFISQELKVFSKEVEEITPERVYIARNQFKEMRNDLIKLNDKHREVIIRSCILGQTYAEISSITGWSPAAISRYHKAAMGQLVKGLKIREKEE